MKSTKLPNILGLLAILFWSTSIGITRLVSNELGQPLQTIIIVTGLSGLFGLLLNLLIYRSTIWSKIKSIPFDYYYRVGIYFILYLFCFYFSLGLPDQEPVIITVGLINYLWILSIFVLSIPILKKKVSYVSFGLGSLIAIVGIVLAVLNISGLSVDQLGVSFLENGLVYGISFTGAIIWGIYSNMTAKYQLKESTIVIPVLFLITTGIAFTILVVLRQQIEPIQLDTIQWLSLFYLAIFPLALAYTFWNIAMRQGDETLITAIAYVIPVISTFISGYLLNVTIDLYFALAAVMVVVGAVISWKAFEVE